MIEKIYISGKITGLDSKVVKQNFGAAAEFLKNKGFEPVNPLDNGLDDNLSWEAHMLEDIKMLFTCQGIYMLSSWRDSKGAKIEKQIAEVTGIKIMYEIDPEQLEIYLQKLENAILKVTGFAVCEYSQNCRRRELFYPRLIFAFHASNVGLNRETVAAKIGRDQCMVTYYLHKYPDELRVNKEFQKYVNEVEIIMQKSVSH